MCNYGVDCDQFLLTIDVPENLTEIFPSPVLRLELTWESPLGAPIDDYDFYAFDADGNMLGSSAETNTAAQAREAITLPVSGGMTEIRLDIAYFLAVGSTFTGTVQLDLGPASEDADLNAFYSDNPPPPTLGFIVPENQTKEQIETDSRRMPTQGGGALGWFSLLIASGLRLRRKAS